MKLNFKHQFLEGEELDDYVKSEKFHKKPAVKKEKEKVKKRQEILRKDKNK